MENRRKDHFNNETDFARGIDRVSHQRDDFWGRILVISLLLAAVIGNFVAAYVLGSEWFNP